MRRAAPRRRRPGRAAPLLAGLATLLAGAAADASPVFELLGDTAGTAGFSARSSVAAADASATYFNPALLVWARPGVTFGTFVLREQIDIALDARPAGADVPVGLRGGNHEGTYVEDGQIVVQPTIEPTSLPTAWLEDGCDTCQPPFAARPRGGDPRSRETITYATIGWVTPIVNDRLMLGLHAVVPLGQFTAAHAYFVDEREQFFTNSLHPERYGDRLRATSIAFGLAAPLGDHLSLGLSSTIALRNDARAATYVSDSDNQADTLQLSTDVEVSARATPHLGLVWRPTDRISVAASAHAPQRFDIGTGFSAALPNGNEQLASRSATHDYLPWLASLGGEVTLAGTAERSLSLSATATFARWSTYVDRQSDRPQAGYEWSDTLSPTIGARATLGDWRVFGDATWEPTPVPAQTGRTNYVDNSRLGTVAGLELATRVASVPVRIGLQLQVHGLVERHQTKRIPPENPIAWPGDDRYGEAYYPSLVVDEVPDDATDGSSLRAEPLAGREGLQTNNPGFPGFGSSGLLAGGSFYVAIDQE